MSLQRLAAGLLLVAVYAPLHRLLDPQRAGPAALATRTAADAAWAAGLLGTGVALGLALAVALVVPAEHATRAARTVMAALSRPAPGTFALAAGAVACVLAGAVALGVHGGLPTSVDEMAQLLHARALAGGRMGVDVHDAEAAFTIQNGVTTAEGWVSVYPPLHTLALALALRLGAPWIVGPLAVGVATAASARSFERLMGTGRGRVSAALLCVTPFWILLGSTQLSHATAAACLALVLWTALEAREGSVAWAAATGAAIGAGVASRPWIVLVCAAAILAAVWLPADGRASGARAWTRRAGAVVAGGLPFAALLFWWNARLFGSPTRLGYSAVFGPAHGLGLHTDPWGNEYGIVEALGYSGADLLQLGAHLFASPLPALAIVGVGLWVAHRRPLAPVFGAWALAAVCANALYWHHGLHLGPRMLYEATPAWVALTVAAAGALGPIRSVRGLAPWSVAVALAGAAVLAPSALFEGASAATDAQPDLPAVDSGEPTLVFVHGSWASRVAARLSGAGMRRDSIETALRRNDLCAVDLYARWRSLDGSRLPPPALDLRAAPGSPPELEARLLSPGNFARFAPDGPRDAACAREAAADRLGVIELEPLLWRAPPLPRAEVVVARDLGPVRNAELRGAFDGRWLVYVEGAATGGPVLLDYDAGMELLWRGAAGETLR